jgi:dsRNA-specific ribonuclease
MDNFVVKKTLSNDEKKIILNDDDIDKVEEDYIFNPYNSLNKNIPLYELQNILQKYGVPDTVHNIQLYYRAFVHKSYVKRPMLENEELGVIVCDKPDDCMSLKTKSNERLEFLGDGVLECITKYYLYRRFPKENEGFMTEKKIAIVKNEHIGKLAYEMGLHNWYIISNHAEEKGIRTNFKKLGCLFEAFLGALFLDFNKISINDEDNWFNNVFVTGPGFQIAQIFVENIFEKHIDWMNLIQNDDNYKNILQVKIQKAFKTTPTYLIIDQNDEDGYFMGVYLVLNIEHHNLNLEDAILLENNEKLDISTIQSKALPKLDISNNILEELKPYFILLGSSKHKIKKKAEQQACVNALKHF